MEKDNKIHDMKKKLGGLATSVLFGLGLAVSPINADDLKINFYNNDRVNAFVYDFKGRNNGRHYEKIRYARIHLNPDIEDNYMLAVDSSGYVLESYNINIMGITQPNGTVVKISDYGIDLFDSENTKPDGKIDTVEIFTGDKYGIISRHNHTSEIYFWQDLFDRYLRKILPKES